jgi:hypothetical protein
VALALALVAVAESFYLIRGFKFSLKIVFRPWLQALLVMSVISGVFLLLRPWLSSERLYSLPFLVLMGILGIAVSGGVYLLLEGRHPFRDEGGSAVSEVTP